MNQRCLVLMPFSDPQGNDKKEWDSFFEALSERVKASLPQYDCVRVNIATGEILGSITQEVIRSDLIVCDLTYLKPNVLFELGMSMLLEKPTILLVRGIFKVPSDFSNHAYLSYEFDLQSGLRFPERDDGRDLFEVSLESVSKVHQADSFFGTDSNLGKVLKVVANCLKHAIQLETQNPILAPAMRSLLDNLVFDNAKNLSDFNENENRSVVIRIDSSKILFEILIALVMSLDFEDQYDSITWRKHWGGNNSEASSKFLRAIVDRGPDLPSMRRVFLVGIKSLNSDGTWSANPLDAHQVAIYLGSVRSQSRLENRVLFLPDRLVQPIADKCHMGRIRKGQSELFVFSLYNPDGILDSFRVSRKENTSWKFENFWEISSPMHDFDWNVSTNAIPAKAVHFSKTKSGFSCRKCLQELLKELRITEVKTLVSDHWK